MKGELCVGVPGQVPFTAFMLDSAIIAISTAVGIAAKESIDPEATASLYFLYVFVAFATAVMSKLLLYVLFGFGGGSLAPPGKIESVGCREFFYGGAVSPGGSSQSFL